MPNVLLFSVARTPEREALMTLIGPLLTQRAWRCTRNGAMSGRSRTGNKLAPRGGRHLPGLGVQKIARENGFSNFELTRPRTVLRACC